MLSLGSRVRYRGNDCIVVGRTREAHSHTIFVPGSGRIKQKVLKEDLEPWSIDHPLQPASEPRSETISLTRRPEARDRGSRVAEAGFVLCANLGQTRK